MVILAELCLLAEAGCTMIMSHLLILQVGTRGSSRGLQYTSEVERSERTNNLLVYGLLSSSGHGPGQVQEVIQNSKKRTRAYVIIQIHFS